MASILTLDGVDRAGLGASDDNCKCVLNSRTKRYAKLCFVGKGARTRSGKKSRTGWVFAGLCRR